MLLATRVCDRADIRLIDAGRVPLEDMPAQHPQRFAELRRCNLLVHVVRCFAAPPPSPPSDANSADGGSGDDAEADDLLSSRAAAAASALPQRLQARLTAQRQEAAAAAVSINDAADTAQEAATETLLPPTPVEDAKSVRASMAFADLAIIEERRRVNSTASFWQVRARAINEMAALRKLEPALTRLYIKVR